MKEGHIGSTCALHKGKIRIDMSGLPSGMYFVKLATPRRTETKQVLLIR